MGKVYRQVLRFKEKYPMTIGWRLKENASIIEKHLNPGEVPLYSFVAQKNDNPINIIESAVVTLTNKRIMIGSKRVVIGYFLTSITPDMYNDLQVRSGMIWGKVYIDTVKEFVALSNIGKDALQEIETAITKYMMEAKRELLREKNKDED